VYDFHLAVGQFVDYRIALKMKEPDRILFVGITEDTYEDVFELPFPQMVIQEIGMKIKVVNRELNKVVKWIK
jgi:XisH protein